MPNEPTVKRAIAFFDGQNLFYAVRDAFGYSYPNYDPRQLAERVCREKGWILEGIHFYTGMPSAADNPDWNAFWTKKLAVMGTRRIHTFSRPLRYRNRTIPLPDGTSVVALVGQEKGVDIRIALDVVRLALDNRFDIALIFSQDQDFTEVVTDVKRISVLQDQWIGIACAYPVSPDVPKARGIAGTEWIQIDRATYDACIDPNDYRLHP